MTWMTGNIEGNGHSIVNKSNTKSIKAERAHRHWTTTFLSHNWQSYYATAEASRNLNSARRFRLLSGKKTKIKKRKKKRCTPENKSELKRMISYHWCTLSDFSSASPTCVRIKHWQIQERFEMLPQQSGLIQGWKALFEATRVVGSHGIGSDSHGTGSDLTLSPMFALWQYSSLQTGVAHKRHTNSVFSQSKGVSGDSAK